MPGSESVLIIGWEQVDVDTGKQESLHNSLLGREVRLADMKCIEKSPCLVFGWG